MLPAYTISNRAPSASRTTLQEVMAPKVGLEPTTDRLTADCSTTELLRNIYILCLAMSYSCRGKPPTTIGAKELNFRVRYGNGCDLFAIATRHIILYYTLFYKESNTFFERFILSKLDNSLLSKAYAFKSLVKSSID